MSDKPTRIPLARSTGGSSAATKSSILINYGWAAEGGKQRRRKNAPDEESEEETRSQSSSSENVNQVSYQLPSDPVQLSLSQPQLNALSFNLSELADRISPSMHCELEEEDWEPRPRAGSWDHPSRHVDDLGNHVHSKVPYARMRENRSYVSRKKSFTKLRSTHVSSSKSQPVDDERKNAIAMTMPGKSFKGTNTSDVEKAAEYLVALKVDTSLGSTIVKQSSLESGYNSSMSISSISANDDLKDADTEAETDVDEAFKSEGESATDNASKYASLQKKISDVEQRINSLIQGKGNTEIPGKSVQDVKSTDKPTKEGLVNNQIISKPDSNLDVNQNKGENENDKDLKKSPFQLSKSGKGASDEPGARRGPRPGLVRRRTTLVSFRPPRQSPGFSETSNSEVFEMDEAAFVQYLTDVRAMKTMLLKLKRELQEADVASPLSHSLAPHSASTQACSTASSTIASSSPSQSNGLLRRNTYNSGEMHEKLRRIRSASFSRRRENSRDESDPKSDTPDRPITLDSDKDEVTTLREELDKMKNKVQEITEDRDAMARCKEELEHELESKNYTIKLLQKQLEHQDNDEEMVFLKRQVKILTEQVRQQQQKMQELKYRTSTPPNTTGPTKGSVKLDINDEFESLNCIENRLRDAFTRHLEESSKSTLQLSRQIEKAEMSISDAQKGLKSITLNPPTTITETQATAVGKPSIKARSPTSTLGPQFEQGRRHSWTANSIEKIIKTWKETQPPETAQRAPRKKTKSSPQTQLNGSSSDESTHVAYL
ncbi:uncharacterized protein LOC5498973 isoform X3 [Nematostella vectensis]|nr:uncharacterized protein LOC5498973 isoform X3 [Nematostella vectensis]